MIILVTFIGVDKYSTLVMCVGGKSPHQSRILVLVRERDIRTKDMKGQGCNVTN